MSGLMMRADACKIAKVLGFDAKGGKGSHNSFSRTGEPVGLNFQKLKGGKIPPYQAKQLIVMIDKYYADEDELPLAAGPKKMSVRRRTKRDRQ
jgi:hypothetical protein